MPQRIVPDESTIKEIVDTVYHQCNVEEDISTGLEEQFGCEISATVRNDLAKDFIDTVVRNVFDHNWYGIDHKVSEGDTFSIYYKGDVESPCEMFAVQMTDCDETTFVVMTGDTDVDVEYMDEVCFVYCKDSEHIYVSHTADDCDEWNKL